MRELEACNALLEARLARLELLLGAQERSSKRQAAPFSKGPPKDEPKTPGRKPGNDYGTKSFRAAPDPQSIDEVHDAPLVALLDKLEEELFEGTVLVVFQV